MVQFVQCERALRAASVLVTDTFFVPKNTDYIYRDNRTGRLPYLLHCSKYNTTSTVISDIERRNGSFFSFAETKVLNFSPSMSVRLSVYFIWPPHATAAGLLLLARWPGDRLLHGG